MAILRKLLELFLKCGELALQIGDLGAEFGDFFFEAGEAVGGGRNGRCFGGGVGVERC